jgi:hypothetical protein
VYPEYFGRRQIHGESESQSGYFGLQLDGDLWQAWDRVH